MPATNDFAASSVNPLQSARGGQQLSTGTTALTKVSRSLFSSLGTSTADITMMDGTILLSFPLRAGYNNLQVQSVVLTVGSGDYVAALW